jgi:predicted amidohydrolase
MKLAVAAYPIDWHNRWNEYVGKLRLWVRTAAEGGASLLVFPEFAALELASLAGEENARDPRRATEALTARLKDVDDLHASLAREFAVHIVAASGPVRSREGGVTNRARLFAPEGGRGAADQAAPPADVAAAWGLAPGPAPRLFETALAPIGVLVGADVAEPRLAQALARAGARLLVNPAWAAGAEAAAALRAAALARAAETGRVVAQACAIGVVDWIPALGRGAGAAGVYAPPASAAEGVLAAGKADAAGWVQAEIPAALLEAGAAAPSAGGEPAVETVAL